MMGRAAEVWVDPIPPASETSSVNVAAVHFTPGARSAWHCHGNTGQTLYVTEGQGLVQTCGEAIVSLHVGDTVHTPADEWHWALARRHPRPLHDAHHITDGAPTWGDHVTADEYNPPDRP
jgi:quercetin dioxygenase-like cupin family protein